MVFLNISLSKSIFRFGKKDNLSPRYIRPFEVLERISAIAYMLALPPQFSGVHDDFNVCLL